MKRKLNCTLNRRVNNLWLHLHPVTSLIELVIKQLPYFSVLSMKIFQLKTTFSVQLKFKGVCKCLCFKIVAWNDRLMVIQLFSASFKPQQSLPPPISIKATKKRFQFQPFKKAPIHFLNDNFNHKREHVKMLDGLECLFVFAWRNDLTVRNSSFFVTS